MAARAGKLIPPAAVMARRLEEETRATLRERIVARVLAKADVDGLLERAMERRAGEIASATAGIVEAVSSSLGRKPRRSWTASVRSLARRIAGRRRGG